ncbi:cobalt transporter [Nocardioides sp. YR527]|uniref:HoxN/HupN/NixA family nickel/cobalt transporter n=1 Tax=Nocardioides sp. YR527 TaxID=1881028 RepID=UPI00210EC682|nr:cobalt transporter [Nocardioides sp. YR527]
MDDFLMGDWFGAAALVERVQGYLDEPGIAAAAFVLAFAAGAAHAIAPGHGKTLAAAYLIGAEGRVRDAAWLGGSVAVMHTFSVLVIAVAWAFFSLSDLVRLENLTAGLQIVAGVLVVGTGLWLLRRHWRAARSGAGHGHSHGHSHAHGHGHGHGHSEGVRRPGIVLLGISGGLTPSPGAFLVLVTGLFAGRSAFALLLVITFGLGMATILFGVGLLALAGNNLVVRVAESKAYLQVAAKVTPILAALGVTVLGAGLTVVGVGSLG